MLVVAPSRRFQHVLGGNWHDVSGAVSLGAGRYTGKDDTRLLNWVNEFNGNEYLVPQIWNGPVSTAPLAHAWA